MRKARLELKNPITPIKPKQTSIKEKLSLNRGISFEYIYEKRDSIQKKKQVNAKSRWSVGSPEMH